MPRHSAAASRILSALLAAALLPAQSEAAIAAAGEVPGSCKSCTRAAVGDAEDSAMLQAAGPHVQASGKSAHLGGHASSKDAVAAAAIAAASCAAKAEQITEGARVRVRKSFEAIRGDFESVMLEAGQTGVVKQVLEEGAAVVTFPRFSIFLNKDDLENLHLVVEAPPKSALIVVDMQNDFINGTLPVPGATDIIPSINDLLALEGWAFVGFTMDFHPHDHASFAANHPGAEVFSRVDLDYTKDGKLCSEEYAKAYKGSAQASCRPDEIEHSLHQTLWPTHCVQGTIGQKIHEDVVVPSSAAFVRKGFTSVVDSYGAFESRIGTHESNLALLLRLAGVRTVYTVGLALDYCVKFTSLQAATEGFETKVVEDATKAVTQATGGQALDELSANGIARVQSASLTSCR